jgi:hypothetical protein
MFFSLQDPDAAVCMKYKFESGSFYHQTKIVGNTLIHPYCFVTSLCPFSFEK